MSDDAINFRLILFLVLLAFLVFGALVGGIDFGVELNKPVPMWLWLLS